MKRKSYICMILVLLLGVLTSCQPEEQNNVQPPPEVETDTVLIEAMASDSIETERMTKLREFSVDLDLDNIEESIELYTAAQRNENGEMMWDDGQNWVLTVCDGDKSYPLLSQYVQLGVVHFMVSNSGTEQMPDITVLLPTDSSFRMMSYAFDKEKGGYIKKLIYESKDDNWLYSSIPGY
ncbi:MAG: hypothetical protein GX301_04510 [Gracilibacteraceae bacterium]|jgi:hypothetical protein|nr:hypothetical protein [Gracilibacteraceae bacterium]